MVDATKALEEAISKIDWTKPEGRSADGHGLWSLRFERGLVPFETPVVGSFERVRFSEEKLKAIGKAAAERVTVEPGPNIVPPDATGDPGDHDEKPIPAAASALVSGIASSTSVDFYGTEMSEAALRSMAAQMTRGIPFLPRHNYGMFGASIEWDEVIGRTIDGEVLAAPAVAKAFDGAEAQFVLRATAKLYDDEPKAMALLRRIERGEPVGQSIGGWFTSLQVVSNEEGEVLRVIVLDTELDHLALTRAPANPDSVSVASLRSQIGGFVRDARSREAAPPFLRHIASMTRGRDGAVVVCDKVELRALVGADPTDPSRARDILSIAPGKRPAFARHIQAIEEGPDSWTIRFSKQSALDEYLGIVPEDEDEAPAEESRAEPVVAPAPTPEPTPEPSTSETVDAHQTAPAMAACAKAEQVEGRLLLSFDAGASDDALRSAIVEASRGRLGPVIERVLGLHSQSVRAESGPGRVDSPTPAAYSPSVQAPSGLDARGSALPSNLDADSGVATPETAMPEPMTPDVLRQIVQDAIAPLAQRLVAIEGRSAVAPTLNPNPVAAPPAPEADWKARAEAAERTVAHLTRGERVGRAVAVGLPPGPMAGGTYAGLIERARADAPTLATVADSVKASVLDETGGDPKVRQIDLVANLGAVLNAAEIDGVITNPFARAAAGWR